MISNIADVALGDVWVETSNNGGHDPEFWARVTTDRLVSISEQADPHIRMQAEAFRQQVYDVILNGMKSAIFSDRTTVAQKLRGQGHADFADILKEL
jgi:hypothetical protein|tara:strand:- start:1505 stop:1795 length:291 start_codon:yes stop_codon:yes gene_type:complete